MTRRQQIDSMVRLVGLLVMCQAAGGRTASSSLIAECREREREQNHEEKYVTTERYSFYNVTLNDIYDF